MGVIDKVVSCTPKHAAEEREQHFGAKQGGGKVLLYGAAEAIQKTLTVFLFFNANVNFLGNKVEFTPNFSGWLHLNSF